jgi:hypothetical protein
MTTRTCKICGVEKELNRNNFYVRTDKGKTNFRRDCIICNIQKSVQYKQQHEEERSAYNQKYYVEHKQQDNERSKNYYLGHREESRLYHREYAKRMRKTNPIFKIRTDLSTVIRRSLKLQGGTKESSCFDHLSYTCKELKQHLEAQFEPWMNWDNHGKYVANSWNDNDSSTWTWQIDHIIPQSKFSYVSMEDEEFQKCWALNNLRPLSSKQNFLDGVRRIRHESRVKND